jgi:two-component system, OmpR family, response regulator QseB
VRLLLVEDNPMNRRVVRLMLDTAGIEMDEAEDGKAGIAALDAGDYDLVLMDLRMPGMDGLTAVRHIRNRGDDKAGVPIIVVTADNSADIRQQCLAAGADDHIMKPIALSALFDAIGRALAQPGRASAVLR